MSVTIENQIESILAGELTEGDETYEIIDSFEHDSSLNNYVPICQKTVTYIVVAVVLNEIDKVLMMQEAKASCKGKWYLPAGRVECNETLVDAVKREVLEETGLILEPDTLILVQSARGSWFRFVFTGKIIGGSLKTLEQANEESLQAQWVNNIQDLELRSNDVLSLIERGKSYILSKNIPQHPPLMPVTKSLSKLLLQLVISAKRRATNKLYILVADVTTFHLPTCEINPNRSLLSTLHKFMVEIFGDEVALHKPHGLLSTEFSGGQGGDGFRLTLLVSFKLPLEEVSPNGKYIWHAMPDGIAGAIESRLPRNMTVPLNVVR